MRQVWILVMLAVLVERGSSLPAPVAAPAPAPAPAPVPHGSGWVPSGSWSTPAFGPADPWVGTPQVPQVSGWTDYGLSVDPVYTQVVKKKPSYAALYPWVEPKPSYRTVSVPVPIGPSFHQSPQHSGWTRIPVIDGEDESQWVAWVPEEFGDFVIVRKSKVEKEEKPEKPEKPKKKIKTVVEEEEEDEEPAPREKKKETKAVKKTVVTTEEEEKPTSKETTAASTKKVTKTIVTEEGAATVPDSVTVAAPEALRTSEGSETKTEIKTETKTETSS